jgi:hypothetical protein
MPPRHLTVTIADDSVAPVHSVRPASMHNTTIVSYVPVRFGWLSATALLLAAVAAAPAAQAQGRLEAQYAISVAGIAIGTASWTVDIGRDFYAASASGRASGIASALVDGEGAVTARGAVRDGRLVPALFAASIVRDNDKSDARMVLDNGDVKELVAKAKDAEPDRIPVTAAHRHGVVDPISAMLIPVAGGTGAAGKDACRRTLPIFDGRRRYDLQLTFKRLDKVKAATGYAGPAVVCVATFKPRAGHRASSKLVKFLAGRDITLWLAPIAGAPVAAPFRVTVSSMFGNLVVEATRFDVSTRTAAAAPAGR